jgi:hypothetical protein
MVDPWRDCSSVMPQRRSIGNRRTPRSAQNACNDGKTLRIKTSRSRAISRNVLDTNSRTSRLSSSVSAAERSVVVSTNRSPSTRPAAPAASPSPLPSSRSPASSVRDATDATRRAAAPAVYGASWRTTTAVVAVGARTGGTATTSTGKRAHDNNVRAAISRRACDGSALASACGSGACAAG